MTVGAKKNRLFVDEGVGTSCDVDVIGIQVHEGVKAVAWV
jgi:hypothetical protein